MTTEQRLIEKLEELVKKQKSLSKMNSWKYETHRAFTDAKNTAKFEIVELESEIAALKAEMVR
jgi:hypothetical protein